MFFRSYDDDVKTIAQSLPKRCQGCLMSATLNPEVEGLKQLVLHTPAILKLNDEALKKADPLKQFTLKCSETDKFLIAYVLIRLNLLPGKTLFFVNSIDKVRTGRSLRQKKKRSSLSLSNRAISFVSSSSTSA